MWYMVWCFDGRTMFAPTVRQGRKLRRIKKWDVEDAVPYIWH